MLMGVFGVTVHHVIENISFGESLLHWDTSAIRGAMISKGCFLNDMMYSGTKDFHYHDITI